MTPEQLDALRAHVAAAPALASLAASGDDSGLAAALNTPHADGPAKGSRLTALGVLDVLGPEAGAELLLGVEAAAGANPLCLIAHKILWMISGGGLDFGDPRLWAQLDWLVKAGVVRDESAAALKAYGTRKWSLAEVLLGASGVVVTERDAGAMR